jgi:hypothetical protein
MTADASYSEVRTEQVTEAARPSGPTEVQELVSSQLVMLWLYITAYVIILGAELNCELERQTVVDTTSGPEQPLGERGAYAADTLGRSTA